MDNFTRREVLQEVEAKARDLGGIAFFQWLHAEAEKEETKGVPYAICGQLRTEAEGASVFTTCEGPGYNCDGTPIAEETP